MRYLITFFVLATPFFASANSKPLEYYLKDSDYLDVALSPSGDRVAARVNVDGKVALIVIDRASKRVLGGLQPEDDDAISGFNWVSDERIVFTYAEQFAGTDQRSSYGELYAVNFDGTEPTILAGFRASNAGVGTRVSGSRKGDRAVVSLLDVLPDDKDHVLITKVPLTPKGYTYSFDGNRSPIIARLNIKSGRQRTIERLPFRRAQPLTNSRGEVLFVTYLSEDGETKSAYRETPKDEWTPISDAFELNDDLSVVGLNAAGTAAFLYGPHGERGFRTLFRFDLEEERYEPLFTNMNADITDWLVDPENGEIVIGSSSRGRTVHHYTERASSLHRLHKTLVKAYDGQTLSVVSSSEDGEDLVLRVGSDIDPGSIFIFNSTTKRAEFFWANRSWMNPVEMREMYLDDIVSKDGYTIPVRLTLPATNKPAPLIINPHGGPHGVRDDWTFNYETQLLASRGFAVLQINFRGSGGLGKQFEEAGHGEWGGKMIEDIAEAARWAMSKDEVDKERVCAYGASYGAYASYMLAVREPDMLRCVIGYVGVYDLNIMYSTGDIPDSWGGTGFLERVIGRDQVELTEFSPVTHASKIKAATMIIHGESDDRAPIDHAYKMRAALREANIDPEWLILEESGHGAGNLTNRLILYEALLGFLEREIR